MEGSEHIDSPDCWCEPTCYYEDEETGIKCWLHKSEEEVNQ